MKNYPIALLLAALTTALALPTASACTALVITDKKGNAYSAKTMEYAVPMPFEMSYVPAGTKVVSVAPGNKPGLPFETKYPVLRVSADVGVGNGINMMAESANNQGLSLSTNEMPGSQSPAGAGSDAAKALATTDLALYLLGNFKSVAEVKEARSVSGFQRFLSWEISRLRSTTSFSTKPARASSSNFWKAR